MLRWDRSQVPGAGAEKAGAALMPCCRARHFFAPTPKPRPWVPPTTSVFASIAWGSLAVVSGGLLSHSSVKWGILVYMCMCVPCLPLAWLLNPGPKKPAASTAGSDNSSGGTKAPDVKAKVAAAAQLQDPAEVNQESDGTTSHAAFGCLQGGSLPLEFVHDLPFCFPPGAYRNKVRKGGGSRSGACREPASAGHVAAAPWSRPCRAAPLPPPLGRP